MDIFKARVSELCETWAPSEWWTITDIETKTKQFNAIITDALDEQVPMKQVTVRPSWLIWWTDDLETTKTKVNELFKKYHTDPSCLPTKEEYQEERRRYKSAIKQAKKASWQRFVTEIEEVNAMARLGKII